MLEKTVVSLLIALILFFSPSFSRGVSKLQLETKACLLWSQIRDTDREKNGKKKLEVTYEEYIKTNEACSEALQDDVLFFLFTRSCQDGEVLVLGDEGRIENSSFNKSLPTTFIVHGYWNNITSSVITLIKTELLQLEEMNVIGVDWSALSTTFFYTNAASKVVPVGVYLGCFVEFLVGLTVEVESLHLIGHSLGAHVVGLAGHHLTTRGIVLPRITGLDPAKPMFSDADASERLDKTDAAFVDCIHTCSGELGLGADVCSADFYPNYGTNIQPGCPGYDLVGVCSHSRAWQFYAESIMVNHTFRALQCDTIPFTETSSCEYSSAVMGHPASSMYPGIFFVQTQDHFPFSKPFFK